MAAPRIVETPDLRAARARAEWHALGQRVRSTTPRAVGRSILGTGVLVALGWLILAAGSALLPFALGLVIAYACLPLTNRLDRFMPRLAASAIAVALVVGLIALAVAVVAPPFIRGIGRLFTELPAQIAVLQIPDQVNRWLLSLQPPLGPWLAEVVARVGQTLASRTDAFTTSLATSIAGSILGLFDTVGFIVGLLVIPTFVLTALKDARGGRRWVDGVLPGWARDDIWALLRIADRAGRSFVTVQVAGSVTTGVLIYVGLLVADRLGLGTFSNGALATAVLAGFLLLVPQLGGLFVAILAILFSLPTPLGSTVVYLLVLFVSMRLGALITGVRIGRSIRRVHPLVFVPAVVVLSQFGLLWVLVSGPIVATAVDVVRYLHGRFTEPGRPAGLLPGEPLPRASVPTRLPLVYRRMQPPR